MCSGTSHERGAPPLRVAGMDLRAETVDPEETLFGDVPERAFAELGTGVDQKLDPQHVSNLAVRMRRGRRP